MPTSAEDSTLDLVHSINPRGLLVHEWIAQAGGSEKVFDRFAMLFPTLDMFCLWNDVPNRYPAERLRESWLARTPLRRSKALALPLLPHTWRNIEAEADWMLVSSHLFAHHVSLRTSAPSTKKLVYVHTPARYIWAPELDHRGQSLPVRIAAGMLKGIDAKRALEATSIVANSEFIAARIRHAWKRSASVIHPPVEVAAIQSVSRWAHTLCKEERSQLQELPDTYILGASRFVSYKRLDLVIRAGEASKLPVVIAGSGPEDAYLRRLGEDASVPVHFVIAPSDSMLYALYERALVFVFPAVEDFGIMPVEAMATGTPVVANAAGGAGESIRPPIGGYTFSDESPSSLRAAIVAAAALNRSVVATHAQQFDSARFDSEVLNWVRSETT